MLCASYIKIHTNFWKYKIDYERSQPHIKNSRHFACFWQQTVEEIRALLYLYLVFLTAISSMLFVIVRHYPNTVVIASAKSSHTLTHVCEVLGEVQAKWEASL